MPGQDLDPCVQLLEHAAAYRTYDLLPRFPAASRDIALLVADDDAHAAVAACGDAHGRLDVVVNAGATCVIQPGGSMRDDEVIAAANERGVAMVYSGVRHFRH